MFLQGPQQISDCGEGEYRLRFNTACSEDLCTTSSCPICNEIEQGGFAHAGLAIDGCSAAANIQRVNQPAETAALMMTTNDHADVICRTVPQIRGSMRLRSTRTFFAPGDVGDAHRHGALDVTRSVMAQSLPTRPRVKPLAFLIVETARPEEEGLWSRSGRAAPGSVMGLANPSRPNAPG